MAWLKARFKTIRFKIILLAIFSLYILAASLYPALSPLRIRRNDYPAAKEVPTHPAVIDVLTDTGDMLEALKQNFYTENPMGAEKEIANNRPPNQYFKIELFWYALMVFILSGAIMLISAFFAFVFEFLPNWCKEFAEKRLEDASMPLLFVLCNLPVGLLVLAGFLKKNPLPLPILFILGNLLLFIILLGRYSIKDAETKRKNVRAYLKGLAAGSILAIISLAVMMALIVWTRFSGNDLKAPLVFISVYIVHAALAFLVAVGAFVVAFLGIRSLRDKKLSQQN